MLFLRIITNIFQRGINFIAAQYKLSLVQSNNPTCKFYPGAIISNTSFGNFNVVFNDCIISSCSIDSHTYIQKKSTIYSCDIGKFCSIATMVSIAPGVHPIDHVSTHPVFYLKNTPLEKKYSSVDLVKTSKKVIIGHDVWVGAAAIIMDGLTIGTGAVIAAGSIVTKDVEPYAIVGGCPAKLIKYRFDKEIIDDLLLSKWWDKDENWLSVHYDKFNDPIKFLTFINNDNKQD